MYTLNHAVSCWYPVGYQQASQIACCLDLFTSTHSHSHAHLHDDNSSHQTFYFADQMKDKCTVSNLYNKVPCLEPC